MSETKERVRPRATPWAFGAATVLVAIGCAPPPVNIAAYTLDRGHCGDFVRDIERFWTTETRDAVASGILSVGAWAETTKTTVVTRFDALTARWVEEREALCDAGLVRKTISPDEYVKRSLCLRASLKSQETVALTLKYPSRDNVIHAVSALEHLEQDVTECRQEPIYRTYDERAEDEPARVARAHVAEARGSRYLHGEWAAKAAALALQTAGVSESRGVKIASHVETGWEGTAAQLSAKLRVLAELSDGNFKLGDANGEEFGAVGYAGFGTLSARAELLAIVERVTKAFGPSHPRTLSVRRSLAYFDRRLGNVAQSNAEWTQILGDLGTAFPGLHTERASMYLSFADAQRQSAPVGARNLLDQALSIRRALLGAGHPRSIEPLFHLGALFRERGHETHALNIFRGALEEQVSSAGAADGEVARTHEYIGGCLAAQGHTDLAIAEFRQALSILGALPDVDRTRVAQIYLQMGDVYRLDSEIDQTLAMYRRSIATYREVRRERHPDLVTSYRRVGQVQARYQHDYAGALATYLQVAAIYRSNFGAEHQLTVDAEWAVAWTHQQRGEHAEAQALFERLVAIRARSTDLNIKAQLPMAYWTLAQAYAEGGNPRRALEIYARTLEVLRSAPGGNPSSFLGTTWVGIGSAHVRLGDHVRARQAFAQASEFAARAPSHYTYLHSAVAKLQWAERDYQNVLTSLQRELDALKRVFPGFDITTTSTRIKLGLAYAALKEPVLAAKEIEQAMTLFKKSGWRWSHENATATAFLGMARSLSGDHARALRVFEQAFEIHQRTIGIDHPDAVRTYRLLADAQFRSGNTPAAIATLTKAAGLRHGSQKIPDEDASRIRSALAAIRAGTYRPSAAVENLRF